MTPDDELIQLAMDYAAISDRVIDDLKKRFHFNTSSAVIEGGTQINPYLTMFYEGQRNALLYILKKRNVERLKEKLNE